MNILLVRVRGARYGIPAESVAEIIRAVAVSPLPGAPPVVSGVINLRGNLTAVIDPAVRFGNEAKPVTPAENFVIVMLPTRTVAVRVESADDLEEIDDSDISASTSVSRSTQRLAGVATLPDGLVVIYDVASFLDEAEDAALDHALRSAAS